MMTNFPDAVQQLFRRLSLEEPKDNSGLVSLKVGEQGIHITEYPKNKILMFCHIDQAKIDGIPVLFQQNMFSEISLKPILAQEDVNHDWVLWNRQDLNKSSVESLYQQLELLSYSSDQILSGDVTAGKKIPSQGMTMSTRHWYQS
ncbi:CesT family type III secretion system chaperone [Candidatus Fukatsuia symbiotica]|uniref:Type III secretion protein n=1 Tax=Candidatus Fukatsuia symbiotica TaxID=1878942 RepID=A0A2U8I594_9GAMM|nr:CesT family type III secretion system chaperone [Candidatus Fukatsuia symbiotica]AWK14336.1 type III secretion protein [Candidatus Fukatsuia symbiotica]MEA9444597.1 CesT family type III secretion system chaperone [Candidatus Fukatsuia symbiotica]